MKYRNKGLSLAMFLSVFLMINSCAPTSETIKDESIPEVNLNWNEKDSESIADSLVSISLQAEWNKKYFKNRKPKIVVGKIENKSEENIDVSVLAKDLERSLINSGEVSFIASKEIREMIRADRKNESDFAGKDSFIKYMKPLNADFFMSGTINSQIDSLEIPNQKKFELSIKIISTKDASVVWEGAQSVLK